MSSFKYRTSAPGVTPEAVRNVETQLGVSLPGDYVKFISFQNGGSVDFENKYSYAVPDEYPDPPLCLESFFQVEQLPVECDRVQAAFGVKFLPIGIDNFGNYICFGLAPHQVGKVFFLDHELIDDETGQCLIVQIADSFNAFVAGLGPDEEIAP